MQEWDQWGGLEIDPDGRADPKEYPRGEWRGENGRKQAESSLRADTVILIGNTGSGQAWTWGIDEAEKAEEEASEMRIWSLGGSLAGIRIQVGDCNQEGRWDYAEEREKKKEGASIHSRSP